jgi:hypothetical protein
MFRQRPVSGDASSRWCGCSSSMLKPLGPELSHETDLARQRVISAASTSSGWTDVASGISDIATIVAVIAGGIFAYYKFARGRIFRMRCGIQTSVKMISVRSQKCAAVEVRFSNNGQGPVSVYKDTAADNELLIYELNELMLEDALASLDDVVWEGGVIRRATLFPTVSESKPAIIESGENFSTSILIPLSKDSIGFRAVAILQIVARGGIARKTAAYWTESVALPE